MHVVLDLTPAQVRGLRLADNRTNQESDWDFELLVLELSELKGLDFDFSLTGFDPGEIDGFLGLHAGLTDPDEVPHLVLCGDCTAPGAVSALLSPTSGQLPPALLVTDPPYGISLDSE